MGHDSAVFSVKVALAYQIARRLVARRQAKHGVNNATAADWQAYGAWRDRQLTQEFDEQFGAETARGKEVLDFGCGDGQLSVALMKRGAKRVHGVDLDEQGLARFADRLRREGDGALPTFSRSESGERIDLPDESFDAICCFDVMEHVMAYREIVREWRRILRPGGRVYISWQPYWHPFGHHSSDWIPIPWVHVFLRDPELNEVCARVVDWPDFQPSVWDQNPDGTRINRFRVAGAGDNFLNKLTTGEFERVCRSSELSIVRREFRPFSLPQPFKGISLMGTKIPVVRDYFTGYAIYELARRDEEASEARSSGRSLG